MKIKYIRRNVIIGIIAGMMISCSTSSSTSSSDGKSGTIVAGSVSTEQSEISYKTTNFDLTRDMSIVAYASEYWYKPGILYLLLPSKREECNFKIEYKAKDKQFIFHEEEIKKYRIESFDNPDSAITSFQCKDDNDKSCEIEFITLPDNYGNQMYVRYKYKDYSYGIIVEP